MFAIRRRLSVQKPKGDANNESRRSLASTEGMEELDAIINEQNQSLASDFADQATVKSCDGTKVAPHAKLQVFDAPKYVTESRTTLAVNKKAVSLSGDTFAIKDLSGKKWFRCKDQGEKKVLSDDDGSPVLLVRQDLFSLDPAHYIYPPEEKKPRRRSAPDQSKASKKDGTRRRHSAIDLRNSIASLTQKKNISYEKRGNDAETKEEEGQVKRRNSAIESPKGDKQPSVKAVSGKSHLNREKLDVTAYDHVTQQDIQISVTGTIKPPNARMYIEGGPTGRTDMARVHSPKDSDGTVDKKMKSHAYHIELEPGMDAAMIVALCVVLESQLA